VAGVERRLAEAARLGFTRALVPPDSGSKHSGLRVQEVGDVALVLDNLR
jgi:DNA repair protein RadA/Sms